MAVNTPAMMPPMTMTIMSSEGTARQRTSAACPAVGRTGVSGLELRRDQISATAMQARAQMRPGPTPAMKSAAIEVLLTRE